MNSFPFPVAVYRWLFPSVTWDLPGSHNELLLTFDDGPVPGATEWILDILKEFEMKAFFFCLGKQVEKFPELFARIRDEGHQAGNHSFSHPDGWQKSLKKYRKDVLLADKSIQGRWFRPPYGRLRLSQYLWLKKRFSIMMWSFLVPDYDPEYSPSVLWEKTGKHLKPGKILVFHDNAYVSDPNREFLKNVLLAITGKGMHTLNPGKI